MQANLIRPVPPTALPVLDRNRLLKKPDNDDIFKLLNSDSLQTRALPAPVLLLLYARANNPEGFPPY